MSRPADHATRQLVRRTGLDETLFVEAGAGTGKTTLLVERIANLVLEAGVSLGSIAAITFTEAAAAELQSRIRAEFERTQHDAIDQGDVERAARCQQAIDETDLAAITTVHGFANRLLGEFSVAAGLPPRVRVLDEVASQLEHEARWQRFVDRVNDDPAHEALLVAAASLDIALEPRYPNHTTMRDVAVEFNQNWDRLGDLLGDGDRPLPPMDFSAFDAAVDELSTWLPRCVDPGDKLLHHLQTIVPEMRAIVEIDDPHRKLRLLAARHRDDGWKKTGFGKKASWPEPPTTVREAIVAVNEAIAQSLDPITDAVLRRLAALIADEIVAAAEARRAEGGLEFHDLLVLARDLLRSNAEARRDLNRRYSHLLLDEFQDTDPIQIELAVLIATDADDVADRPWTDLPVAPGRLFFVGDPKQSIYRFRRADIGLFLRARDRFAGPAGAHQLTTNFRTVGPIVDWVNAMFAEVMPEEQPERQPRYEPLAPHRQDPAAPSDHAPILLGGPHPDPKVRSSELRAVEAADVVGAVRAVLDSPGEFMVERRDRANRRMVRPASLSDITILLPTRTSLPFLTAALDEHGIRYRIATGTLVYDTQEIVDALAALRAIDDPSDTLSLIAALRSPLYACSDVDLHTFKQAGGRWDHRFDPPDDIAPDHPVVLAFEHLRGLWRQRWFLTPSTMLDRLLRERQAAMLAFGANRPIDVWRRLRFLVEQARAYEESASGGLRGFCEWAALQSGSMARVHEPLLPETDEQALSIQTIHGAKGLEFPITILSGMTTQMRGRHRGVSVLWGDVGPPEIRVRSRLATMWHEPRADLESEMDDHERLRLAYVAVTRARDHLIVSCHHKQNQTANTYGGLFHELFADPAREGLARRPDLDELVDHTPPEPPWPAQLGLALDARNRWIERRESLLEAFQEQRVLSATRVAREALVSDAPTVELADEDDDDADRPDEGVVPDRRRGRTGSAIGSAVHGVLQIVDLADPQDVADVVDQQAHAEGIPQHNTVVGLLVQAALDSDAVRLAAQHRHHKELFVAAPVDDRVVEGYVDLLIEGPDGLVVVDYKTDAVRTDADIDAKLASYELQAAAYAVALEQATGLEVVECRFVFLRTRGTVERSVADLPAAKAQVRSVVGSATATVGA